MKKHNYNNTCKKSYARARDGRFVSRRRCPVRVFGYVLGMAVMVAVGLMVGVAAAFEPSELMAMFK